MSSKLQRAISWADRMAQAQHWMDRRFHALSQSDLKSAIHVFVTANIQAPNGFDNVWSCFTGERPVGQPLLCPDACASLDTIVIFFDGSQPDQVVLLQRVVDGIADLHEPPLVLAVAHSVAPESRSASLEVGASLLPGCLLEGLDGIVSDEPEGFGMALALRAAIAQAHAVGEKAEKLQNDRRPRRERARKLQQSIDALMWTYARGRLGLLVPCVEDGTPQGLPARIVATYKLGPKLGRGAFGTVFRLDVCCAEARCQSEALKVMNKASFKGLEGVLRLNEQIKIMKRLNCQEHRHPLISQLYEVYHTPSHIIFRIEFGGQSNLYKRLNDRDRPGEECRPMTSSMTRVLVEQAVAAVSHLHSGPQVCHLDIKPENFVLDDSDPTSPVLRLVDFDMAVDAQKSPICQSARGTMPFAAPEVLLHPRYDGKAADVWSLGVVFLEVHIGTRVIDRALGFPSRTTAPAALALQIRELFDSPDAVGAMLTEFCREEARPPLPALSDMLRVKADERCSADHVAYIVQQAIAPAPLLSVLPHTTPR